MKILLFVLFEINEHQCLNTPNFNYNENVTTFGFGEFFSSCMEGGGFVVKLVAAEVIRQSMKITINGQVLHQSNIFAVHCFLTTEILSVLSVVPNIYKKKLDSVTCTCMFIFSNMGT